MPARHELSRRRDEITQSDIRAMTAACTSRGGINLAQGVCDLGVPEPVRRGAAEAMNNGFNCYTHYSGLPAFRDAIAEKMRTYNGIDCSPVRNVVVSAGSTGAFYCACLALLDPGDEVILFEPYYGYHVNMLRAVEAMPRFVTMTPPDWSFAVEDVERVISSRTRAMVICTPGNPSGKVFSEQELRALAELAVRHELLIFTDEIYEYFLYEGRRHVSPASFPEIADRTITISGYSKTFSITGWRIGYCVCPERFTAAIGHINDLVYVNAPSPLQMGVATGIRELPASYYSDFSDELFQKRERICRALRQAGLAPYPPQGAYYVLADASCLPGEDSRQKAMHLLESTGVAGVPGSAFYDRGGEHLIRFCYAKPDDALEAACSRLAAGA